MAEENNKIALKIKNITNKLLIGLDIGGTLTKVCIIISKEEKDIKIENFLSGHKYKYIEIDLYKLYFCHLHSANYKKDILPILNELNKIIKIEKINATGGGAYKYYDLMKKDFGIEFIKNDEMRSLIYGYEFMNKYNSFYEINNNITKTIPSSEFSFPHISANIGSGVSFLKVSSPYKYERVGGTSIGGGTLIGLSKLIFGIENYDEILELVCKGNAENVDLTLNNIIGEAAKDENRFILSLGKIQEYALGGKKDILKKEDILLSLLNMICYNVAQYAVLYAEKNNINTIYYFGTFTKNDSIINRTLNKASNHLNKNIKIRFNFFGEYLGSIGCLLEK